ncbi:Transposase IS4 [Popillia japonica]|uniref:Transposase IS4 n=1 Tax=Popillia japonica TaxID=7064 RepID=A0AAW1HTE6_POPJA
MDNWSFWKKSLTLNELLEEAENLDADIPNDIVILRPDNANNENTDEDSGDDEHISINNLPADQLENLSSDYEEICLQAFQLAIRNNLKHRFSKNQERAGYKWLRSFLKKHPELTFRRPQGLSTARIKGFTEENVNLFFKILEPAMEKVKFNPCRIYNIDETGFKKKYPILGHFTLRAEAEVLVHENNESDSEDDIPLSILIKRRRSYSNYCQQLVWMKSDITTTMPLWNIVDIPTSNLSPIETFFLFFDNEVIDMLVNYSNMYARHKNRPSEVPINCNEIRCFLGILLLSGYVCLPRRELYWENSLDSNNALVTAAMSRNRFRYIMQNIHCSDNTNLDGTDKFSKIRPLIDGMNRRFVNFAPSQEVHCIDESMVPYYSRHGTKQFIRGKPIRWGYKLWTGTNKHGYIEWFQPYQGSSTMVSPKYKSFGCGGNVVLHFTDVLQEQFGDLPFDLYFDNFFTSMSLLDELRSRNIKGQDERQRILKSKKIFSEKDLEDILAASDFSDISDLEDNEPQETDIDYDSDDSISDKNYVPDLIDEELYNEELQELWNQNQKRKQDIPSNTHLSKKPKPSVDDATSSTTNNAESVSSENRENIFSNKDNSFPNFLFGKDGYQWFSASPTSGKAKTPARNVVYIRPGPVGPAKDATEPIDAFSLFFNDDILSDVLIQTNKKILDLQQKYKNQNASISTTTINELKALFGLLILSAALKDNHYPRNFYSIIHTQEPDIELL